MMLLAGLLPSWRAGMGARSSRRCSCGPTASSKGRMVSMVRLAQFRMLRCVTLDVRLLRARIDSSWIPPDM